jgi:putative copper resistance protein D
LPQLVSLTLAVLADEVKGKITDTKLADRTKKLLWIWLLVLGIYVVVQISYLLEQPLTDSFNLTVIRSYLTQTSIGKTYLFQLIIVLITLLIPTRRIWAAYFSFAIGLIAIVAPVFQSRWQAPQVIMDWQSER